MIDLRIGRVMPTDGSKPLYVKLLGVRPGDSVEVLHGSSSAPQTWTSRMAPLSWLRETQTPAEFIINVADSGGPVSFLVTLAQPGSIGATVRRMGDDDTLEHPGATPEGNLPWYVLSLESAPGGAVLVTALNSGRPGADDKIPNLDSLSVVVDISFSMSEAARDGRLRRVLASVQQAAQRNDVTAITAVFVADRPLAPRVISVKSSIPGMLGSVLGEFGNRTGVVSDLITAGAPFGQAQDVLFLISDNPPPQLPGRRVVSIATSRSDPPNPGSVYLRDGESDDGLTNRIVAAVPLS